MIAAVPRGTGERTGVLVVRIWVEPGVGGGLRARMTSTLDVTEQDEVVTVASTPDGIAAVVDRWIDDFVAASSSDAAVTTR
jgi:hypothetical protein